MLILKLLIFAIPVTFAGILHMISVKLNILCVLKYPLDFKKTYRQQRIFGDNKTFRGLFLMIVYSIIGTYLLKYLDTNYESIHKLSILDFHKYSADFYGIIFGFAYTIAELPNSFVKRQKQIKEGTSPNIINILIDQVDSPIGCLIAIYPFSNMTILFFVSGIFFFLLLHLFINFLLYVLGLRKNSL